MANTQETYQEVIVPLEEITPAMPSHFVAELWTFGKTFTLNPHDSAHCIFFNRFKYQFCKSFYHLYSAYHPGHTEIDYFSFKNTKMYALTLRIEYHPSEPTAFNIHEGMNLETILNHNDFRNAFLFMDINKVELLLHNYCIQPKE